MAEAGFPVLSMNHDNDYVLCECDLERLEALVAGLERRHAVVTVKPPSVCLSMIRAEDSLEKQEFYLGEALTTECEVSIDGSPGYGVCLGEEPVRGYCLAVLDALLSSANASEREIQDFIARERKILVARETEAFNHILRTQVDFKLMEQE